MQDRRRLLLRVFLITGGTLVAIAVAFFLPVAVAMVMRGSQSAPGLTNGVDRGLWAGYCCGSILVIIVGFLGFHSTVRAIVAYINSEPTDVCLQCGYSLRNLPVESITCPECGFVIPNTPERRKRRGGDGVG